VIEPGVVRPRLMVVDDDPAIVRVLKTVFTKEGFDVAGVDDGDAALARANADKPDLVILDLALPNLDGMQVLGRLKAAIPQLPIVMLTGRDDARTAVQAMRLGAFDYVTKPFDPDEIVIVVRYALEMRWLAAEVKDLRRQVAASGLEAQMGPSLAVHRIIEKVKTVAATNFSVLVLGETGTGKELVAAALHRHSERHSKPFIALDCGAIPEALLESELFGHEKGAFTGADRRRAGHLHLAEGGTLFLDEIGNLPLGLQAKFLRVLESRELRSVGAAQSTSIDVRFIAATNNDLQARVAAGQFRSDLYFRLAQYAITLPALRERPEDISHLAERFIREVSVELRRPVQGIAADALALLKRHRWPGNVRQLRNVIRQAVLESKDLLLDCASVEQSLGMAAAAAQPAPPPRITDRSLRKVGEDACLEAEGRAICEALRETRGNKSQAARALKTDFKTLHVKMKNLGIRARDFELPDSPDRKRDGHAPDPRHRLPSQRAITEPLVPVDGQTRQRS
jgi:DNA-binding NtrC family response regulator